MAWIESHQNLRSHPKMLRLAKLMGWSEFEAIGRLHAFWWWCLDYFPMGAVAGLSPDDLMPVLRLSLDDAKKFLDAMKTVLLIDADEKIHDWNIYAGQYLKHSKFRRQPDKIKQFNKIYNPNCRRTVRRTLPNQPNLTLPDQTLPQETPLPPLSGGDCFGETEKEKDLESESSNPTTSSVVTGLEKKAGEKNEKEKPGEIVNRIFTHWQTVHNHPSAKLDEKRKKKIVSALKLGYSENDLLKAVDGCSLSPFHQGENENGRKYDDLELILRDAKHVDDFIRIANNPPMKGVSAVGKKNAASMAAWLDKETAKDGANGN